MSAQQSQRTDNSATIRAASTHAKGAGPIQHNQADYTALIGLQFERIKELEANEVILLREHRILYAGYENALFVVVDLLEDVPLEWRIWLMENVYRHSISAAVFADIANHFIEVAT
jgi:hypothetical protein